MMSVGKILKWETSWKYNILTVYSVQSKTVQCETLGPAYTQNYI